MTEFLYDFIIVWDPIYIPLLADQLSRIGMDRSSRVKRLDFMCIAPTWNIRYREVSYDAKQLARAAAKIIRLCPRLQALSSPATLWERHDINAEKCYTLFLAVALAQVQDTLTCLEWRSCWSIQSMTILSGLTLPHLRILHFSSQEGPVTHLLDYLFRLRDDAYLPRLPDHSRIANYLPSLRHIAIDQAPYCGVLVENWHALSQLNTVAFNRNGLRHLSDDRSLPPTVHTIILHAQELPIRQITFPHIKRIGLMGAITLTPTEYDYAFDLFVGGWESGYDHFPSLNMIRFMDISLSELLGKRGLQFKLWERRSRSKGVRVEDKNGHVITHECL